MFVCCGTGHLIYGVMHRMTRSDICFTPADLTWFWMLSGPVDQSLYYMWDLYVK